MGKRQDSKSDVLQNDTNGSQPKDSVTRMRRLFGFDWNDFASWQSFIRLMNSPRDASQLGVYRFLFGLLMVIDIPQERGLAHADYKWGDPEECRFPLFDFLAPLPIEWMYIVYLIMLSGAIGIMLGFFYRISCVMFTVTYWYVFLLDKVSWNNHSYLYGLHGILFLMTDANRYWSIDGLFNKTVRNAHIPVWNYFLFRFQFFLVYFIAGLKKLDADWVGGYSMTSLSKHWVFDPFKLVLSDDLIDLIIVHWGGLTIDLFMGYLLFFDATRKLGLFFGTSFHVMNSQIFSIGMFPYAMLASNTMFFWCTWPKTFIKKFPKIMQKYLPSTEDPQTSDHCLYEKEQVKTEGKTSSAAAVKAGKKAPPTKATAYHKIMVGIVLWYSAVQCFLPYSHFVTKGYNNWTNGLYGYSWDMMVHSWSTQHVRIEYVDHDTGKVGYLNPEAWSRARLRWTSHADMLKQYSYCIAEKLRSYGVKNVSLHFDIWRSLNERFQQRLLDPRIDLLTAEWHPFKQTSWLLPLLTDLSDWRGKLDEIEKTIYKESNTTEVVFIADYPGLVLENYIQEDFGNTSITVLKGEVVVVLLDQDKINFTLKEGQSKQLPAGQYHDVHTVTDDPSCYMYIFVNTTENELNKNMTSYTNLKKALDVGTDVGPDENAAAWEAEKAMNKMDPELIRIYESILSDKEDATYRMNMTMWEKMSSFVNSKYHVFKRSVFMTKVAVESIVTGQEFAEVFNATMGMDDQLGWQTE